MITFFTIVLSHMLQRCLVQSCRSLDGRYYLSHRILRLTTTSSGLLSNVWAKSFRRSDAIGILSIAVLRLTSAFILEKGIPDLRIRWRKVDDVNGSYFGD